MQSIANLSLLHQPKKTYRYLLSEIAVKVDESGPDAAAKKRAAIVHSIKSMKKSQCLKACSDLQLITNGRVKNLRDHLATHYQVDLTIDDDCAKDGPKHKAK